MRWILAVAVALAACTHEVVAIEPHDLAAHGGELAERGRARVFSMPRPVEVSTHDRVTARLAPSPEHPVRVAIGALLDGCPHTAFALDDATRAAFPDCALFRADKRLLVVRDRRHFDKHKLASAAVAALAVAAQVGLVACAARCHSPYSWVSGGVLIAEFVAIPVGIAAFLSILTRHG